MFFFMSPRPQKWQEILLDYDALLHTDVIQII